VTEETGIVDLVVPLEHRFLRTPDGAVWTQAQLLYAFWTPYLSVFDRVRAVARVRDVPAVPEDWKRADGPSVAFAAVPYYIGPWQYLLRSPGVWQAARRAVGPADAVLIRGASPISSAVVAELRRERRPFGLEVLGDPYEALAPGAVRHPLRPFFRWWFTRGLQRECRSACAAAYVTAETLQQRYPCPGYTAHFSDVQLEESGLLPAPRPPGRQAPFTIVTVGSLEQLYKGPHVLIDAVADCIQAGLDLVLILVGDGKHRPELETQAAARGLCGRIRFRGQLTAGKAVRQQLDEADLFVLPSFTEGLPRAMIEAMARALPCLGSHVGGIPELLAPEDMAPPGDRAALARKLQEVVTDPARLARMSARNLAKAREYRADRIRDRQIAFYRYLRQQTEAWLERKNGKASAYHDGT
jgi:glycosyltransferase involved in cell wall biosynthesis